MSFICGFFNSINGDRKYSAEQMNNPYHRIVSNGVFAQPDGSSSTDMQVVSVSGFDIKVVTGEGIFFDKWAKLDADMLFTVPTPNVTNPRIDSVIVRIDTNSDVRAGSIIYKEGEPARIPTAPALERSEYIKEYRLANIRVNANVTGITQANITDTRPSSDCGFISNLLADSDIEATYAQWQEQFEEWFRGLREELTTVVGITSFTSRYVTSQQDERDIPVQILRYNKTLDILQVYINGLLLIENVDYTITDNTRIRLTKPVDANTPVAFIVYKMVDTTEAESVVENVELLMSLKITNNGGGTKINVGATENVLNKFAAAGVGVHTMYSPNGTSGSPSSGAFRYLGHMTNAGQVGWLIGMQANGSVYANYMNGGEWQGWRALYEVSRVPLYKSANGTFPPAGYEITPTKPLSECQNGWQLIFTGYDDETKIAKDFYTQVVSIPKRSYKDETWNGESMTFPLVYSYNPDTDVNLQCTKTFTIYNTKIVASQYDASGVSRNMVLRAIYEY